MGFRASFSSLHENRAIVLVLAFFRNILSTFYVAQMTDSTLHYQREAERVVVADVDTIGPAEVEHTCARGNIVVTTTGEERVVRIHKESVI